VVDFDSESNGGHARIIRIILLILREFSRYKNNIRLKLTGRAEIRVDDIIKIIRFISSIIKKHLKNVNITECDIMY
jgi:hypothetical protein